ncbi:VDR-a-like nuclear receptor [Aphelenchoides fujianensis]|nr:VDR-a-like nuclear receptor [Aphelenchoides fujianensis]
MKREQTDAFRNARCLVCNDQVLYKNFRTLTCNGCGAFFRRMLRNQRSFVCRSNETCDLLRNRHKRRCASCRFVRCVQVGMIVSIQSPREVENPLRHWILCRRSNFTARRQHALIQLGSVELADRLMNEVVVIVRLSYGAAAQSFG